MKRWTRMMQFAYLGVLVWQLVWLGLLPAPYGPQNWWLAVAACVIPLLPLAGVLKAIHRSMIYAGVIMILYFTFAVMEIWTTAGHRLPASFQVLLVIVYLLAFKMRIKAQKAAAMAQELS